MQSLPSAILCKISNFLNIQEYLKFYGTCKYINLCLPKKLHIDQFIESVQNFKNFNKESCKRSSSFDIYPETLETIFKFLKVIQILKNQIGEYDRYYFALSHAIYFLNHNVHVLEILLKKHNDKLPRYWFNEACKNGQLEVVRIMIKDPRVNPSDYYNIAIQLACEYGHLEIVKMLMSDPRVDPSANFNHAIGIACENKNFEMIKLLMNDPRVDPADSYNNAIGEASANGALEIVKLLLSYPRVDPSAHKNYALRMACENGHLEIVKLFLNDPRVDPSAFNDPAMQLNNIIK